MTQQTLAPTAAGRVRSAVSLAADLLDEAERHIDFAKHSAALVSQETYAQIERLRREFNAARCMLDAEAHGPAGPEQLTLADVRPTRMIGRA